MKTEKDDLNRKNQMPKARSDERTITHETIPGQKPAPGAQNPNQRGSMKDKASTSTMDEDLN